jgi:hypothetical protein
VTFALGVVDAHTERDWVWLCAKLANLAQALQDGIRAVREHQARPEPRCVLQDLDETLDDERLAAGERELLDADCNGLVDQGPHIGERDAI